MTYLSKWIQWLQLKALMVLTSLCSAVITICLYAAVQAVVANCAVVLCKAALLEKQTLTLAESCGPSLH